MTSPDGGMEAYKTMKKKAYDTAKIDVFYKLRYLRDSTKTDKYTEGMTLLMVSDKYLRFGDYNRLVADSLNNWLAQSKENATSLSGEDIQQLSQELDNLKQQYAYAENVKEEVRGNILSDNFTIQLHSQFGIAYDGDNVNSWSDFMKTPCELLRASSGADTDLALLQLKSKSTPQGKYVFEIDEEKAYKSDKMKINQPLYMIGYNYGVALAKTNKGIKAQFTSGTLTQLPDGNRITYSIPAKQGSSGSPVVDDDGRLVAVNFAGSDGSDNFNFGIPMLRVLTFLK